MPKKTKLPKTLLVYVQYENDGKPYYVATTDKLHQLPEDADGEEVGYYQLAQKGKLRVNASGGMWSLKMGMRSCVSFSPNVRTEPRREEEK